MGFGGFHPYPRRFAGGKPQIKVVHDSLNAQRGTAYDATNSETTVWLENHAIARAITFDGWGTNTRLANQRDPLRMTDMLPRWERIFKIVPSPSASDAARRLVVLRRFERFGKTSNHARLTTALAEQLGDFFVAVEYIPLAVANVNVPDGTYPWGTPNALVPWSSTVAHVLVLLQKPTGASEGQFYEEAGKVKPLLDPIMPAWCTISWYRAPELGAPISIAGGPSMAGFYCDNAHNLDNNILAH